jgi:hypothetical protein
VLLAIHLVRLAAAHAFDLAVVVSADNDLVPALELVCDIPRAPLIESVSFRPEPGCEAGPPLGVSVTEKRKQIARSLIGRADFERVEDLRSYNPNAVAAGAWSSGEPLPGQSGRELPSRRRS